MDTIYDYLKWRGDLSFRQNPFNEVDAAILARFCYEPFEDIVSPSLRTFSDVKDVCDKLLNRPSLRYDVIDTKYDLDLIRIIADSPRFANMQISGFVNEVDEVKQVQFSACVFHLDGEQNYFVAFRGTDNTIIGWKEDFNMGFEFPVPAQEKALAYFENAVATLKDGTFIVGGHSKGGNLAIYAATYCDDRFNSPVTDIYNFDGPGFTEQIMNTEEFQRIEHQIHTYVPEFSVVGMLLEHMEDYSVVHSDQNGIMQHEILTWETGIDKFIHKKEVSKESKLFDKAFKDWIRGLDKVQREQFVDTVFKLMMCSDAHTLAEFTEKRKELMTRVIGTYQSMDAETKQGFKSSTRRLFDTVTNMLKSSRDKLKE